MADLGGQAQLRMAKCKAGPVVTDNGMLLLDWYWNQQTEVGVGHFIKIFDFSILAWLTLAISKEYNFEVTPYTIKKK